MQNNRFRSIYCFVALLSVAIDLELFSGQKYCVAHLDQQYEIRDHKNVEKSNLNLGLYPKDLIGRIDASEHGAIGEC